MHVCVCMYVWSSIIPAVEGLLGSLPTASPAWKHSLDSQAAACRYQGKDDNFEASFTTRVQALAASRAEEEVSKLHNMYI